MAIKKKLALSLDDLEGAVLPSNKQEHIGIEFEVVSTLEQEATKLHLVRSGLERNVSQVEDGSIQCSYGYLGHEFRLLAPRKELKAWLNKMQVYFKDIAARTNLTCGLHVHLDMRQREVSKAYVNLVRCQELLYNLCHKSRRDSEYCRKIDESLQIAIRLNGEPLNALTNMCQAQGGQRYYGINHCAWYKHKTLEVRMHHGTADTVEVRKWCQLLLEIVDAPMINEPISDLKGLLRLGIGSFTTLRFVKDRLKKYNSVKVTHKEVKHATG